MDDMLLTSSTASIGQAMPAGELSSLLASRPGTSGKAASWPVTSRSSPRHQLPEDKQALSWQCLQNAQISQQWSKHHSITSSKWQSTTIQKSIQLKTSTPQQERYWTQEE